MPYTPPAAQSPAASRPETPSLSRTNSYNKDQHQDTASLPHSSSSRAYLSKHRRSPSTKTAPFHTEPTTPSATPPEKRRPDIDDEERKHIPTSNPRLSPTDRREVPTEPSPSVSPLSSSDDEATARRGRAREVANVAELQAAIAIIEQHRAGSPDETEETEKARITLGLPPSRLDLSNRGNSSKPDFSPCLPLSAGARKISHSRSSTDTSAFFDFPRNKVDRSAQSASDSELDELEDENDLQTKPPLIRKKSGELVRPALRASSTRRRPSSMPGTPTYSKAVHFQDNSLEHVRHFLQVDRPIAVSAGSSPVDSYEEDIEFPFDRDESSPPFEWAIQLSNFPPDTVERRALPVRTEKVYLSPDTKVLIGAVAVRNLAFRKKVAARFTLDYWKTTSEVVAEYQSNVGRRQTDDGWDRFTFNIKLEDQTHLENKTMFFCVRYNVNGKEYWDNNNSINYQVDFSKTFKPRNGKQGAQAKSTRPLNALPRSRPSATFSSPRPRSMPSFDDFAGSVSPFEFSSFPQPSAVVGDTPIRFRNKPSSRDMVPDAPSRPKGSVNQQAFGNRYDFSASLSAAIQGATAPPVDRSGLPSKDNEKSASHTQPPALVKKDNEAPPVIEAQPSPHSGKEVRESEISQPGIPEPSKPIALTAEKSSLQSSSYHELLDKYCFVCSGHNLESKN